MVLKFIALGDMGSGEKEQFKVSKGIERIIKNLKNKRIKNISFIVGLGDNIYECGVKSSTDKQFKNKFEKPYKNIDKKFYMCLGNHDYSGPEYCLKTFESYEDYKDSPLHEIEYSNISKKWIMPGKYYYYTYAVDKSCNADFFVIDTNIDRMGKKEQIEQLTFITDAINKSTAKWKILYGHHPWRSLGGHGHADNSLEQYFRELINKTKNTKIDLYMCGHDHNKQYIELDVKNKYKIPLMVCGTGGKEHELNEDFNIKNSPDNDYQIHYFSNTLGFACIKIYNAKMELFFFNHSGKKVEFRTAITK